jgi:hypothetical protein
VRLVWEEDALDDLERAAEWSWRQAASVVSAMEWMADRRASLADQR